MLTKLSGSRLAGVLLLLTVFMSETVHEKYPQYHQKYWFELLDNNE